MILRYFAIFVFTFLAGQIYSNPANYEHHAVKAKKGDGVYSLLRRYDLANDYCNIQRFYEQNKLSKDAQLHSGNKYLIPVYIYKYDGKSIRSTIGNDDWKKAVRIKTYNENLKKKGLRQTNYLNSKILWVPHHELHCYDAKEIKVNDASGASPSASATPPSKPKPNEKPKANPSTVNKPTFTIPIFGSNYKKFTLVDNSLKGRVFYLVSGHGGIDPGTRCEDCTQIMCEDEYAYDITLRLARNLMQHGAVVEIIIQDKNDGIRDQEFLKCDKDEVSIHGKKIPNTPLPRLNARAADVNHLYKKYKKQGYKDQKVVMIHIDSNRPGLKMDSYFLYNKHSSTSKEMAQNMYETFKSKYAIHQKNRVYRGSIKEGNLFMLKRTIPPALFVELANIKNSANQKRLTKVGNRQALADWLMAGLAKN